MASIALDPRFTFDTFVIGTGNRLAVAASRRVAESPGTSYNPFFVYGASGLGKTHLITALGHHARRIHREHNILYDTLEHLMEDVMEAIEAGERDAFRSRLGEVQLLLLDDVQFLAGRHRTQEELIRAWDVMSGRGGQIVLASDRPPPEIDGLDERLLSRFSGGLIVDIAAPDYETRIAILRRNAEARGQTLDKGVAEAIARTTFANVRELQGSLNRLIAIQELEGRTVPAAEVQSIIGAAEQHQQPARGDEFGKFLADISGTVGRLVNQPASDHHFAAAIMRFEADGYRTRRLEDLLASPPADEEVEQAIRQFEADVERLREITGEIISSEAGAPELARLDILRDPDRVSEAEQMFAEVRERNRPLPAPPSGVTFDTLNISDDLLAVRAARAVAQQPGTRYNPLFVHGGEGSGKSALLIALGAELQTARPDFSIGYLEASTFASELIRALEVNRVEGWRERYRRAHVLMLDNVDALVGTERAQEELFHLFDALQRSGAQLVFAARVAPRELVGIEDRLRSRLESGLVVELPVTVPLAEQDAEDLGVAASPGPRRAASAGAVKDSDDARRAAASAKSTDVDDWFENREKLLWDWAVVEDWTVEGME
jgi:chromosomal replication initiator protein